MNTNSSKGDRRRQQRVQGSWNKPVRTNDIDALKKRDLRNEQNHVGPFGHCSPEYKHDARFNSGHRNQERHGVPSGHGSQDFRYDNTVANDARRELEEERGPIITNITEAGNYELSIDRFQVPATVRFFPDFLTRGEADTIFDFLSTNLPWQQRTGLNREGREYKEPRLTCWFGEPYTYSHVAWESNQDWPQELLKLRTKVSEKTGIEYNSVMCNLYRNDKDSIGWHADDEPSLGKYPNIASISLGDARTFELKRKEDHYSGVKQGGSGRHYAVRLPHGSLMIMAGSVQDDWLHRVPKEYHDHPSRINLTFRVIVNSPDQKLDISQSSRNVISRAEEDKSPAVVNFQQRHLNIHSIQESSNYFMEGGWVRPLNQDGNHMSFQMCSFTSYDQWPDWLVNAGRDVIQICSSRSDRRIEWSSAQCIFLQRGTEYVPWRYEKGQNPVALVCLWGERPVKLRRCRSAAVIGDLKHVTIMRCGSGDVCVMEGNLQKYWTFSIPRDPRATYSTCFLLLRAEEPFPVGTLFQAFDEGAVSDTRPELPRINLQTAAEACGHADLCERCLQALSLGQIPDCPVCRAELKRSADFTHP